MLNLFDGKVCSQCKQWQVFSTFAKRTISLDGLAYICRICTCKPAKPALIDEAGFRFCRQCNQKKHVNEWPQNVSTKSGFGSCCKSCHASKSRQRNARLAETSKPVLTTHEKRCSSCKKVKSYTAFSRNRTLPDGYCNACKACCSVAQRNWRTNNPDHVRSLNKKYWKRKRQIRNEFRRQNRDKGRAQFNAWKSRNRARYRALMSVAQAKRKTLLRDNGGFITPDQWLAVCAKYGHNCLRCGEHKPLTMDHVIPVSKGGSSNPDNIQPLCFSCNASKGAKTIDYRPNWEENG